MKRKKLLKRSLAVILSLAMVVSFMPTYAFATDDDGAEQQIRDTLRSSVSDEDYPDGMFDFLTPRMETSEDNGVVEFAVVRRGNTDSAASVTFKAIDMTAKYGEDYEIKIERSFIDKKLKENPDSKLAVEEMFDTDKTLNVNEESEGQQGSVDLQALEDSADSDAVNGNPDSVEPDSGSSGGIGEEPGTDSVEDAGKGLDSEVDQNSDLTPVEESGGSDGVTDETASDEVNKDLEADSNAGSGEPVGETLDEPEQADEETGAELSEVPSQNSSNKVLDLRSARTALTGAASDYTDWREADEKTVNLLSNAYNDMYSQLVGVEYTLDFAPGEYMKTIKFITKDDRISEDEEQVLFVLMNPVNGAVSENPTGFMNIVDNEAPEDITYGFEKKVITVSKDEDKAILTIERKTGLYRYGTVTVSSASGTAESGIHYDAFSTELAFVPGQQYRKIEIPIKKHPVSENAAFQVRLDGSETAQVSIEPTLNSGTYGNSDGASLMSEGSGDEGQAELAADNVWIRTDTVNANVSSNSGEYSLTWGGNPNCICIPIGSYNQSSWVKCNMDLSMVGKMDVYSKEYYKGTWYDDTWWFFGTHGSSGYHNEMANTISLGNSQKLRYVNAYDKSDTITLSDTDRQAGYIKFKTSVWNSCREALGVFDRSIKLHYLPIQVQLAEDSDSLIQKKTYTSAGTYKNSGNAFQAGKIKFAGMSSATKSKYFYNEDIVTLEPEWTDTLTDEEKDGVYLWGFKVENKAGASPAFYYVKTAQFSIKDLYTGKLKDSISGLTVGKTAELNQNDLPCYRIYPVYRQKTAFTSIKVDSSKAQFATGTYSSEEIIRTGVLDKIQINIAGKGNYAVGGYSYFSGNRAAQNPTTVEVERTLFSTSNSNATDTFKQNSPEYNTRSDWSKATVNADASNPGSYLFSPEKTFNHLVALYEKPEINVTVNPGSNSSADQAKGIVVYTDDNGGAQVAKYTGLDKNGVPRGSQISIAPFSLNKSYQLMGLFNDSQIGGATEKNYKFQWWDLTGDIDRNGELDAGEIKALGKSYDNIDQDTYVGNVFSYSPGVMGNPLLYYQIVPKSIKDTSSKKRLSGTILLKSCSVIENSKLAPKISEIAIAGAPVAAGGETTTTDDEGMWEIRSEYFDTGENYLTTLTYGGKIYTGSASVGRHAVSFTIDEYNTFNVRNFKAYTVTDVSEYDNIEVWKQELIGNEEISNEDKRHLYTFQIQEMIPSTAVVGKVEVERHSSDGTLKKTYTAVYNSEGDYYEVKDPALLTQYKDKLSDYNYSFNPATDSVAAGDYLTIRVYDQYDVGYIKHNVGITYKPKLSVVNIVNSFKSPFNGIVEFLGDVDMAFDLGMTQTLDNKLSDKAAQKLKVETTEDSRTISFGWSKDFEKSYDSNEKKDEDKDKGEGGDSGKDAKSDTPKSTAEKVKDEAKKTEALSGKTDDKKTASEKANDDKLKKDAKETADAAVDKDKKDAEKTSQVTAELKVTLSVAVSLEMGYDKKANRYYFQNFAVVGTVNGTGSAKQQYTTPIGITLFAKEELSGNITGMMAIEPYYRTPLDPEYLYMDEAGTIDLTKLGNADVDRQLSIYGKLMIQPKVTLSVGAAAYSDKIASITLNGSADFDMMFNTAGNGIGNVTLNANLVLDILGGTIKKKWDIANKKYNMFNINGTEALSLMDGLDYRYDIITPEDTDQKLYLKNRGEWNSGGDVSLATTGTENYNENVLLRNSAYPYAYPQILTIEEGSSFEGVDSLQLMTFLDADENSTTLKYSTNISGDWSEPGNVDDDGTDDDTPRMYDLGDTILVTWSSEAAGVDKSNITERLNSRNIKAVFYDKASKRFGDITYVTKNTEADNTANDHAAVSYYETPDGQKQLIISYVKTEYKTSAGGEVAVGDILNAYSTIAYRFYDFDREEWVETYSADERAALEGMMTADEVDLFEAAWYGQGFADLSKYVKVDESNIKITGEDNNLRAYTGLWSRQPDSSEISIETFSSDPMVVEHESICCGKYGVSAYIIDIDRDSRTIDDQEIFLQYYDFEQKKFYPMMRLTNDAVNQSYVTFSETPYGVEMFYINDGDIVEYNISNLTKNLLSTTADDGTEVLVNSKYYLTNVSAETVVKAEENNPYTEFIVNCDGYNVYLTWTENGLGFKEGIDRNTDEATKPENYYSERQMYLAVLFYDRNERTLKDASGADMMYPANDSQGNPIDYDHVTDVNGNIGQVKAGDPVVEYFKSATWTKPVQMTDELGASFRDIDCVNNGEGVIRCVYLKGLSHIDEVSGKQMPVEDTNARSLIVSDFNLSVEKYTLKFNDLDEITAGTEGVPVSVTVKNESVLKMDSLEVVLSQIVDGDEEFVGTVPLDVMTGGDSEEVTILWDTPDSLEGVTLKAQVYSGEYDYDSITTSFGADSEITISDAGHRMLDRNRAEYYVTVTNEGSEAGNNQFIFVKCGDVLSKSEELKLQPGETRIVTFVADIPEAAFTDTSDAETIRETAEATVYTSHSVVKDSIVRSAPAELAQLMENVSLVDAATGTKCSGSIAMDKGELLQLAGKLEGSEEVLTISLSSDNESKVSAINSVLTGEQKGNAKVTALLSPQITAYTADNTDQVTRTDGYNTLPSSLIKAVEVDVNVGGGGGGGHSGNSGTTTPSTPVTPEEDPGTGTGSGLLFSDVAQNAWYFSAVKYAFENGLMKGITDKTFVPDEDITRAMFVTVLYRMEKEPQTDAATFADVVKGSYYEKAVAWATANGIVKGISDTEFAPDNNITREQLAAILYRYAEYKKYDTTQGGMAVREFDDYESISDYALSAMGWAVNTELLKGIDNKLMPQGNATRAQVAAILERFSKNIVK